MDVVVPVRRHGATSLQVGAPATLALLSEGYEVREVVMQDDYHYARLIRELFDRGRGFILVEDDVVPWPGALAQFAECEHDWCAFPHPRAGGWPISGCVRFADRLVEEWTPDTDGLSWTEAELSVRRMLQGHVECHVHGPPCAHVKPMVTVLRPWLS